MAECTLIYEVQRYSKYVISINVIMYRMMFIPGLDDRLKAVWW
jgi:hypothetical protein